MIYVNLKLLTVANITFLGSKKLPIAAIIIDPGPKRWFSCRSNTKKLNCKFMTQMMMNC